MNQSIKDLVGRGYDINEVESLVSFNDEDLELASNMIFNNDSKGCSSQERPVAIFIGGQPGSGKSVMSMKLKSRHPDFMEIAMDNYRMYHPNYRQMEDAIKRHWVKREKKENDTPGNDIASFTHMFSGEVSDIMIEKASENNLNMLIEWNMREPYGPLSAMSNLRNKGYRIMAIVMAVNEKTSEEAYKRRADIMNDGERTMRRVSERFHTSCINDLPASVNVLKTKGIDTGIIGQMLIVDRHDKLLWDKTSNILPGDILTHSLNGGESMGINNYAYALASKNKESEGFYKMDMEKDISSKKK